jgi:hypothetical protein
MSLSLGRDRMEKTASAEAAGCRIECARMPIKEILDHHVQAHLRCATSRLEPSSVAERAM